MNFIFSKGTYKNEMKRLEDYLDNKEKKCKDVYRVHVTDKTTLDLCGDVMKVSKSCRLVIIR